VTLNPDLKVMVIIMPIHARNLCANNLGI